MDGGDFGSWALVPCCSLFMFFLLVFKVFVKKKFVSNFFLLKGRFYMKLLMRLATFCRARL